MSPWDSDKCDLSDKNVNVFCFLVFFFAYKVKTFWVVQQANSDKIMLLHSWKKAQNCKKNCKKGTFWFFSRNYYDILSFYSIFKLYCSHIFNCHVLNSFPSFFLAENYPKSRKIPKQIYIQKREKFQKQKCKKGECTYAIFLLRVPYSMCYY